MVQGCGKAVSNVVAKMASLAFWTMTKAKGREIVVAIYLQSQCTERGLIVD